MIYLHQPIQGFYYLTSKLFSGRDSNSTVLRQALSEITNTFSIITTVANPLMEKIHNLKKRMPLIIKKEDEAIWIDKNLSKHNILSLIKPFDENQMTAYTVSRDANNVRFDRNQPQLIDKVVYNELPN